MQETAIFSKINSLDSLRQERRFLIQKYKNFKFERDFLLNIFSQDDLEKIFNKNEDEKNQINIFELLNFYEKMKNYLKKSLLKNI